MKFKIILSAISTFLLICAGAFFLPGATVRCPGFYL